MSQTDRLAQSPFDPIALDRASQNPADRKAYSRRAPILPLVEHGHVRGKMAASLFIDPLEVGVLEQPQGPGEKRASAALPGFSPLTLGLPCTAARSVGAH